MLIITSDNILSYPQGMLKSSRDSTQHSPKWSPLQPDKG